MKYILNRKKCHWGHDVLSSIYLRRELGREPTSKEVNHCTKTMDLETVRSHVSAEEFMRAMDNGEEVSIQC